MYYEVKNLELTLGNYLDLKLLALIHMNRTRIYERKGGLKFIVLNSNFVLLLGCWCFGSNALDLLRAFLYLIIDNESGLVRIGAEN